jgi:hypothetical protein
MHVARGLAVSSRNIVDFRHDAKRPARPRRGEQVFLDVLGRMPAERLERARRALELTRARRSFRGFCRYGVFFLARRAGAPFAAATRCSETGRAPFGSRCMRSPEQ